MPAKVIPQGYKEPGSGRTRLEVVATLQLAVPALLGALLLVAVPSALVGDAYPDWTALVADQLDADGRAFLGRLAVEKAQLVTDAMQYYSSNQALMADFYASLITGEVGHQTSDALKGYHGIPSVEASPSTDENEFTGQEEAMQRRAYAYAVTDGSGDATSWPSMDTIEASYSDVFAEMQQASVCDVVLEPVYRAGQTSAEEFVSLAYLVTEEHGAWRTNPWRDQSWLETWEASATEAALRPELCPEGKEGYDGRCRSWYDATYESAEPEITFYVFGSTGELGGTMATALYDDLADPVGVIGLDISMAFFGAVSGGTETTPNGFGIIFDADGLVISHAELDADADAPDLTDFLWRDSAMAGLLSEQALFDSTVREPALDGDDGVVAFSYGGAEWRAAFAPVFQSVKTLTKGDLTDSSVETQLRFVVAFMAPYADLVAPATELDDSLSGEVGGMVALLAVFAALGLLLLLLWLRVTLRRMGRPLALVAQLLSDLNAGKMRTGDLADERIPPSCREIDHVLATADHLSTAVGFAHEQAQHGDLENARLTYARALKMFTDLGHAKGISVCDNNLGNVYRLQGEHGRAEGHFLNAIAHAEAQLAQYQTDAGDDVDAAAVAKLETQLANRHANYAMVLEATQRLDMAVGMLQQALTVFEREGNQPRYVAVASNLIRLLGAQRAKGQHADAADKLVAVIGDVARVAASYKEDADAVPASVVRQTAHVARGRGLRALDDLAGALGAFEDSLKAGDKLDPGVEREALTQCAELLGLLNETARRDQCREHLNQLSCVARDVVLALDTSGSMTGVRMRSAKACLTTLCDHVLRDGTDRAALLAFSTAPSVLTPLAGVVDQGSRAALTTCIEGITPSGRTALWDAIGQAANLWKFDADSGRKRAGQRWVVVLTDGEDTSSRAYQFPRLKAEVTALPDDLTLLIIGVGIQPEYAAKLNELCKATPAGIYFSVSGDTSKVEQELHTVFGRVAEIIEASGEHWEAV